MRVLITGVNGLLGQEAVRQLREHGHEVIGWDLREVQDIPGRQIDVTLAGEVLDAMAEARPHAILHTAGLVGPLARRRSYAAAHVNVLGTLNLLEAARTQGVKRFVLCSTALVYDYARAGPGVLTEDGPLGPADVYGGSKLAAEALAGAYARDYGLRAVALRFTRIYGPVLELTEGSAMKELGPAISAVLAGREVTVTFPQGARKAEYVYVKDAARACRLAIEVEEAEGPYNVGSGEILGPDEVLAILCEIEPDAARWIRRDHRPATAPPRLRSLDIPVSLERAAQDLGYRPRFRMREGLADLFGTLRQEAETVSH